MQPSLPVLSKFSWILLFFGLFTIGVQQQAQATHAMGSDLTYRCLGGNTYEITLTIYRDCVGSALTSYQNISLSSASCGLPAVVIQAPRVSVTELSPLCPVQQPLSTCNGGPLPGVEEHVYRTTYTFPAQCPDWKLAWHLCCRNYAVTNSVITPTTRMYIEAFLNNTITPCNNSPTFDVPPVPYICDGDTFQYNNGAVDVDGDSLVFELVDPLDFQYGPTGGFALPVPYVAGFNNNYPVSTAPPNNFNFDQNSGQFLFVPNGLQQGIVALLVKEYRNGVLIGTTMRDLQMVVINCANQSPNINPPVNITGGQFNGNTFSVCVGNTLSFSILVTDVDAFNTITVLSNLAASIPGATLTLTGTNPVQVNFSWPTTMADLGNYFFTLSATDDGCPIVGQDVVGYNIVVQTGEVLPPTQVQICPEVTQSVNLTSTINPPAPGGTWAWTPATGVSNPNSPATTAFVDSASVFTVTHTPAFGCPISQTFEIVEEAELTLSTDSVTICLGDSVQLQTTFTVNGPPVGTPTYTWIPTTGLSDPFSPDPVASPTQTTTYTVNVSTLNCTYSTDLLVEVNQVPVLDPLPNEGICQGDSVTISATGSNLNGTSFQWLPVLGVVNPDSPTSAVSPQVPTTYSIIATNSCGADTTTVFVDVENPMQLIPSVQDISCAGAADGNASLVVSGGAGGTVFTWNPAVATNSSATNLDTGLYQVFAVDQYGCRDTVAFTISEPEPLLIDSVSAVNIDCFGAFSGEISVFVSGGTTPYQYSLNGGTTLLSISTFSGLPAGTYVVDVIDANGCQVTTPPIPLTQPVIPVGATLVSKVDADCNNPFGQIDVTGLGGTAPYTYSLNNGPLDTASTFTGLTPGYYEVTIMDSLGCDTTLGVEVFDIADPYATVDSVGDVTCFGGNDGFIQITGNSGTPPYTFTFNGGPPQTTSNFTNLVAGTYQIILEDSIGCQYNLNLTIEEPDSLFGYLGNYQNVECVGDNSGALLVLAGGGTPGYTFSLDGITYSPVNFFPNLSQGNYTAFIQDANGCIATLDTSITEPPLLVGGVATQIDPLCFGDLNGSIALTANGGTAPYLYSLDGQVFFQTDSFSNLGAGTYQYFVRDANGCEDIISATLVQPDSLTAGVDLVVDARCFDTPSGEVTLRGSGGTPPYQYSADGGANFIGDPVVTGLPDGSFVFLLRDVNGCLAQAEATINEPPALSGSITPVPITCFGDSNGTAQVMVGGGVAPYSYLWNTGDTQPQITGLGPGNYIVSVTDDNDCQISVTTEIVEPPAINNDSLVFTDASCFGLADGTAAIAVSGGAPPFSFAWSNGSVDSAQTALAAGDYIVTVTDTTGCSIEDTVAIAEPPQIESELIDFADAFCDEANGFIQIQASGGAGGFNYQWDLDSIQIGPTAINLFGDSAYAVLVTDANGCAATFTYEIGGSPRPVADFVTDFFPQDSFILADRRPVQFINRSTNAIAYFWDFGDGNVSELENPAHVYRDTGTYEVLLVAWDPNFACPDTALRSFTLLPPGAIYVPNAFTPNGDGHNEDWGPNGVGIIWVRTRIYSRWGLHITTLNGLPDRWDGKYQGRDSPEGVYVYVVEALINDGTEFMKAGTVTLFR